MFSFIMSPDPSRKTVPVALKDLFSSYAMDWGVVTAAGVVATIPVLLLFWLMAKYLLPAWRRAPSTRNTRQGRARTRESGVADVALVGVNKWYGDFHAVNDLNLAIHDREFMVILGPSGSGKTTALRMIAGLEPLDSGEIKNRRSTSQRSATQGPRHRDGFPELRPIRAHDCCREHRLRPPHGEVAGGRVKRRVLEVAELLGLERWLTAKPRHLSGGMQQRVALGAGHCSQRLALSDGRAALQSRRAPESEDTQPR